jgi:alkylhydroperoxidase/carboxymuconolactone decarboxylase family protein YurZ
VEDYKTTLRRLALRDDRYIESLLADERTSAALSGLDPGAHALARVGALIAMDAAPPSYMSAVEAARHAGVTHEEIVGALIAVLPVVGVARVVSAAPNLGLAIGYDVGDALERLEPERPRH